MNVGEINNLLKVLVIDDEDNAANWLSEHITNNFSELKVVGVGNSVSEGVELINQLSPDLVFLDIKMDDGTGFDLLKKVNDETFSTIFTTAYSNYAIEAFKVNALNYLLKPIDPDELKDSIKRAFKYSQIVSEDQLNRILNNIPKQRSGRVSIKERNRIIYIDARDILYIKADGRYSTFYLSDGTKKMSSVNLGSIEKSLADEFLMRTHRSYIININRVKEFIFTHQNVIMSDGAIIPISNSAKSQFLAEMNDN